MTSKLLNNNRIKQIEENIPLLVTRSSPLCIKEEETQIYARYFINRLAQLGTMQFIQCLEKALNCTDADPKHFAIQCLKMTPLGANTDKEYFIHVHGSVILKTMLDFQRPAKPVSNILELSPEELVYVLSDAKGCYVRDAFCSGEFVGVKAWDKIIWKLKGYYQKLALSQHGSRALEQIFNAASIEQKVKIMTEISDKSNLLNSTSYGRLIATKLDINTFKLSQKKWEQSRLKKPE